MESAIKYLLKTYFEEYVLGLDNLDTSKLPVTISNLTLKEAKIKEDMEQDCDSPLQFIDGTIGKVQFRPVSLFGQIQVVASDVVLNMHFNPIKAVQRAMKPAVDDETDLQNQVPMDVHEKLAAMHSVQAVQAALQTKQDSAASPMTGAPNHFCALHKLPEKRLQGVFRRALCSSCGMVQGTHYTEFTYCEPCAAKLGRCMICATGSSHVSSPSMRRFTASSRILEPEELSTTDLLGDVLGERSAATSGQAEPAQRQHVVIPGGAVAAVASLLPGGANGGADGGHAPPEKSPSLFSLFRGCGAANCMSAKQPDSRDKAQLEQPALRQL
mmetsp:Transcript_11313/g.25755  ORF Transcript_11313/g.25755 Transcript_11313/m.25755 type:complete len:327 (-) Transcript_11313:36-1016(-)